MSNPKFYVILSLKHSSKNEACFWRADNSGYTINPWQAGIYTEEQVKKDPSYYNDGYNTVAICITNSSLSKCGIHVCLESNEIKEYRSKNLGQI